MYGICSKRIAYYALTTYTEMNLNCTYHSANSRGLTSDGLLLNFRGIGKSSFPLSDDDSESYSCLMDLMMVSFDRNNSAVLRSMPSKQLLFLPQ